MEKTKVHIIYIVEDGVASLTCGVGAIAHNFIIGFDKIINSFNNRYNFKLSIVTIKLKPSFIGVRKDLFKISNKICQKHNGKIYFIDSRLKPTDNYFNFGAWGKYNKQANRIIKNIIDFKKEKTIIIYNDTIFGHIDIKHKNCFNVWIPHSLSENHKQSYADNNKRLKWEKKAVNIINQNKNAYLGYISEGVKKIVMQLFDIQESKMLAFKNGFYLPLFEKYKYSQEEIVKTLKNRGIPIDKKIIFSFNRADEYKGSDIAMKVIIKIVEKYSDYHGVLVASRFSKESMIDKIHIHLKKIAEPFKDRINLFLDYEFDLPKYLLRYKNTKILLNLPTKDFCPLVPFESELIGHNDLCVVNSDINCFSKTIKDDYDGFLCPVKIEKAFKVINKIIKLPEEKRKLVIKKGKLRTKKKMNLIKNYKRTLKFLLDK